MFSCIDEVPARRIGFSVSLIADSDTHGPCWGGVMDFALLGFLVVNDVAGASRLYSITWKNVLEFPDCILMAASMLANSISAALFAAYEIPTWLVGGIITVLSLAILLRGIKRIGHVCSVIVPFMAFFYFVAALLVILVNAAAVPAGVAEMFRMAFSPDSVAGGIGGSIVASALTAMRWGVARGVFSNEAGLGSAPIAAAAARTDHPSRQGYVNMTGTFFDTMIVCMLTGLVIASSGVLGTTDPATGKLVSGAQLTLLAFASVFGDYAKLIVSFSLALFAFSTILGWEYYGEKALEYLVKARSVLYGYRVIFSLITFIGATTTLDIVWNFSDTMNGLMAIPNLICLIWLSNDIAKECFEYEAAVVQVEKKGEEVDFQEIKAES